MCKPTNKLTLTKTDAYTVFLMLNSLIDEFYDEVGQLNYDEMFKLISQNKAFSFFERYQDKCGMVKSLNGFFFGLKKDEFNYILSEDISNVIDLPRKWGVSNKGINVLLTFCFDLYANFDVYEEWYNSL